MIALNTIDRFFAFPKDEQALLLKGILISGFFYFIVKFLPLKFVVYLVSTLQTNNHNYTTKIPIIKAKRVLNRICRNSPWKMNCLNRAITYKLLLNNCRVKSELILCIKKNNSNLEAHAYLSLENGSYYNFQRGYCDVWKFE